MASASAVREWLPRVLPLGPGILRDVAPCGPHFALWVRQGAEEFDAAAALHASRPSASASSRAVRGLAELFQNAAIDEAVAQQLRVEIDALGAVDVQELRLEDWRALPSWARLRPLERRRLVVRSGV